MGFIITSNIELPSGINTSNVNVSCNGNLMVRKNDYTGNGYILSGRVLWFISSKQFPLLEKNVQYIIQDPAVDLFSVFYSNLKEEYPQGTTFQDN